MARRRGKLTPGQIAEAVRLADFAVVFLSHYQQAAEKAVSTLRTALRTGGEGLLGNQIKYWDNVSRACDWLVSHADEYAKRYVWEKRREVRQEMDQTATPVDNESAGDDRPENGRSRDA